MTDDQCKILHAREDTLKSLKAKLQQAKERIDFLEAKIEQSGINATYSVNEDLLQISQTIWMHCNRLAALKKINKLKEK